MPAGGLLYPGQACRCGTNTGAVQGANVCALTAAAAAAAQTLIIFHSELLVALIYSRQQGNGRTQTKHFARGLPHLHHLLHGVGQGDGHCKGQALRHRNHHDCHSIQEKLHRAIVVYFVEGETAVLDTPTGKQEIQTTSAAWCMEAEAMTHPNTV